MKEGWIDMSILKNDAEVSRAAMKSGIMFNADDSTNMALFNTKQFKDQLGLGEDEDKSLDDKSGSLEGGPTVGLQEHAEHTGHEHKKAETATSTLEQTV